MKRGTLTLTPAREPRPDRSAEFASYTAPMPRARMAVLLAGEPLQMAPPQPAKRKTARKATAAESLHMGRVKRLGCVLCAHLGMRQDSKTDVHHLRTEQGGAQRASNWLVAALCHERCHQGSRGIHGDRSLLKQAKCTEIDLLAWTLEALSKGGADVLV